MSESTTLDTFLPNVRIEQATKEALEALARDGDRTLAAEIRRALREYVNNRKA